MYLMVFGVFIILREYDEYSIVYIRFEDVSLRGVEIVLGLVNIVVMGLILGFMILLLLIRQTKNLCLNKTTYERFTKDVRSTFT